MTKNHEKGGWFQLDLQGGESVVAKLKEIDQQWYANTD